VDSAYANERRFQHNGTAIGPGSESDVSVPAFYIIFSGISMPLSIFLAAAQTP